MSLISDDNIVLNFHPFFPLFNTVFLRRHDGTLIPEENIKLTDENNETQIRVNKNFKFTHQETWATRKLVVVAGISCYGNTCFMQDCNSVTTTDDELRT